LIIVYKLYIVIFYSNILYYMHSNYKIKIYYKHIYKHMRWFWNLNYFINVLRIGLKRFYVILMKIVN